MSTFRWEAGRTYTVKVNVADIPETLHGAEQVLEALRHKETDMSNEALHTDLDLIEVGLRQVGFLYQADIIALAGLRLRELQSKVDHLNDPHEDDHQERQRARPAKSRPSETA
jgi:hypothetical protein